MSVHRRSLKNRLSYILLGGVALLALLTTVFFTQLSRHISEISEFESRQQALDLINNAVEDELDREKTESIITVTKDSKGRITAINSDTDKINRLQHRLSEAVNNELSALEGKEISVPIGTLSGINILTGRGADISLRLHQIGAAKTEIKSEMTDAGINQTKYRLYVTISVEMTAILPAHSTDIAISCDHLIAEAVIVGEIPEVYLAKHSNS